MARKAVGPALLVLLIAIGPQSRGLASATSSGCPHVDTPAAQLTLDEFDASVFCLINHRRVESDLRPLTANPILRRAALGYASSMRVGHFFSHHGDFGGRPTGSTVIGRLREVGYIRPGYAWIVGETLHWATAERSTASDVVGAWMDSAIHRMYLLKPKFEQIGVAAVRGVPFDGSQADGITMASEFGFRRSH
jgi:uncharacterized protein YkwD